MPETSCLIIMCGGGDLATGVAQKLYRAGLPLLILETASPTTVRRSVALSEAVYNGRAVVEDVPCSLINDISEIDGCHNADTIPLIVDPNGETIEKLRPLAVIDSIIAKRNLGTNRSMAPITIALGPGFTAGEDVDAVIETMRGHDLGRLILEGVARPNTGVPGEIGGKSAERVLKAPASGTLRYCCHNIGDVVHKGEELFSVSGTAVKAPFTGLLRGLAHEGLEIRPGMKVGDIDPRTDVDWRSISDKARCLGGAVLEAFFYLKRIKEMQK